MAKKSLIAMHIALTRVAADVSESLGDELKQLAAAEERARNKGQMESTAFQEFDQKANQLMNILASILKALNEMRSIGAGSRSGL